MNFARQHKELEFLIAYTIGPCLNGYTAEEMAQAFSGDIPTNVVFEKAFSKMILVIGRNIYRFSEKMPEYGDSIAFVCPIQKDRWEVGWMDTYHVRVEGGESYDDPANQLTYWFKLPRIPR